MRVHGGGSMPTGNESVVHVTMTDQAEAVCRLIQKARALCEKLQECDPHIAALCQFREIHGIPYSGPNYSAELEALRQEIGA